MLFRQAVLVELARVRLHGLTQREMLSAAQVQMAETESLFTERDQEYSDSRRCETGPFALFLHYLQCPACFAIHRVQA